MDALSLGAQRTQQALSLLDTFKVATAHHLSRTIYRGCRFPARTARGKLLRMHRQGWVTRWRPHANHPWVYGQRHTTKWRHWLWLLELYCRSLEDDPQAVFAIEVPLGDTGLVPDIAYRSHKGALVCEVVLNGRLNDRRAWDRVLSLYDVRLVVLRPRGRQVKVPDKAVVADIESARLSEVVGG